MIVYQSTKAEFLDNTFKRDIEKVILDTYRRRVGRGVSHSEVCSWKESLLAMAKVLNHDSIPSDCGVANEYGIPQTSKRIDLLLTGNDGDNRDKRAQAKADAIIKNTYRTLMTRGIKGCYLYCTDAETAAHFKMRIAASGGDIQRRLVADSSGEYALDERPSVEE